MDETSQIRHRDALQRLESLLESREHEELLIAAARIESEWRDDSDAIESGTVSLFVAEALHHLGRLKHARERAEMAREAFRNSAEHGHYARAKSVIAEICMVTGDLDTGRDEFDEARCAYRRIGDIEGEIRALSGLGAIAFIQSNFPRAREIVGHAIEVCKRSGDTVRLAKMRRNLGRIDLLTGDLKSAEGALGAESEIDEELTDPLSICRKSLSAGYLHLLSRRPEQSALYLQQARMLAETKQFALELSIYHEYMGELKFIEGKPGEALRHYEQIFHLVHSFDLAAHAKSQGYRLMAEALTALNRLNEADEAASKSEAMATKVGERIEEAMVHRVRGQIAAKRGQDVTARDEFLEARRRLSKLGARYELARTELMIAQCNCFEMRDRLAACAAAATAFEEIGVPPLVEEASAQLSALVDRLKPAKGKRTVRRGELAVPDNRTPLFIAEDPKTIALREYIEGVRDLDEAILITGETGVGKDVAAEYIHATGKRAGRPFLNIHVTNIPKDLWESELFGHEKGAFTGADQAKPGLLEQADGGTVVFNEIGELPDGIQAKLLRFLDGKRFRRVGGNEEIAVDVRVIAATNRDLAQDVKCGRFREDLYYRLCKYPIAIPPLRERKGDILPLAQHFLRRDFDDAPSLAAMRDSKFGTLLLDEVWSGNVRRLESVMGQLAVASKTCKLEHLGPIARGILDRDNGVSAAERELVRRIREGLRRNNGNQRQTAREIGSISESRLRQLMVKHGLQRQDFV